MKRETPSFPMEHYFLSVVSSLSFLQTYYQNEKSLDNITMSLSHSMRMGQIHRLKKLQFKKIHISITCIIGKPYEIVNLKIAD